MATIKRMDGDLKVSWRVTWYDATKRSRERRFGNKREAETFLAQVQAAPAARQEAR